MTTPRVVPIQPADVQRVAVFLQQHLNKRIAPDSWARAVSVPWQVEAPNAGFMLVADGSVVGAYLAFYSSRILAGRTERFCNLGAWCVDPRYRLHSLRLLHALLAQPGYHFTDLSPSGNTVPVNVRMKFASLDTTTALTLNIPWPALGKKVVVTDNPDVIGRALSGSALQIYRDHVGTAAARHLLIQRGADTCYVIFRKDRRKRMRLFASILYVSNPPLLHRLQRRVGWHLLRHHGALATLSELRIVKERPSWSWLLRRPRTKMFRSEHLQARQVDDLYSELVCLNW